MKIKNHCNQTIKEIGGWLKTKKKGQVLSVMASAQPKFYSKDNSDSLGASSDRYYNIYICFSEVSQQIDLGDFVYIEGSELKVLRIEPISFSGEVLYYKATAQLTGEGVYID